MNIIRTIAEMREEARENARRDASVGFVPTMGALHEGHVSLMQRSREDNDVTVASIFVNPTQFNEQDDFDKYPRTFEQDCEILEAAGVDTLFAPAAEEMYHPRHQTSVAVAQLADHLCGISRGRRHFMGVCTVVSKLFNCVQPTRAYFGQKDAQQALIIQRMVIDLNFPVEIVVCPIVREKDGLAMSSRNRRIADDLRDSALTLVRSFGYACGMLKDGERDAQTLINGMMEFILRDRRVEVDYVSIVSPETLEDVATVEDFSLIAGAILIGDVRLIDNILVTPEGPARGQIEFI